ncbi:hypothetical protein [Streptomyces sp. bgisy154]
MNAVEWCFWLLLCLAVWFGYCATSAPDLVARLADRIRHGGGPR